MSMAVGSRTSWLRSFAFWRWPFGSGRVRRMGLLAVLGILSSVASYGLVYRSTVALGMCMIIDPVAMTITTHAEPDYAIQPYLPLALWEYTHFVFAPANWVDRWWRPQVWAHHTAPMSKEDEEKFLSDFTPEELQELETLRNRSPRGELLH